MATKINSADVEGPAPSVPGGPIVIDAADIGPVDKGPMARRVASGKAPEPVFAPDATGTGPVKQVAVSPLVRALSGGTDFNKFDTSNPASVDAVNQFATATDASNSLDTAARGIGAMTVAAPVQAAVKGASLAAGVAPKLASILGGAATGAGTTALAEKSLEHAAPAAAFGGAIQGASDLMRFVITRAISPGIANEFARKGAAVADKATGRIRLPGLPEETTMKDVGDTIAKYEIGSVKNPQVAKEAIEASIARATKASETAWDVVRTNGTAPKSELVTQAFNAMNQANKEAAILRKLLPVANKMVAKASIKPTMLENIATGAKRVLPYAVGAGAAKALFDNK